MARFDANMNMWKAANGQYYPTQDAAVAAEGGAAPAPPTSPDDEFALNFDARPDVRAPITAPKTTFLDQRPGESIQDYNQRLADNSANINARPGGYNDQRQDSINFNAEQNSKIRNSSAGQASDNFWTRFVPNAAATVLGAVNPFLGIAASAANQELLYKPMTDANAKSQAAAASSSYTAPTSRTAQPLTAGAEGPGSAAVGAKEDAAHDEFDVVSNNSDQDFKDQRQAAVDAIQGISRDSTLSDQSRQDQQRALSLQSDLLDRILGFDPNAYASQFADKALASATALGRSGPGGAAARQAGIFNAQEQMPSIEAEAQRQAQTLENTRLAQAQNAVGKFGDLAYGVRAQDTGTEEFNAGLTVQVASQMGDIFDTTSTYDTNMIRTYADIYTELIRAHTNWAQLDSNERIALWDNAVRSHGQELDYDVRSREIGKKYPKKSPTETFLGYLDKGAAALVAGKNSGLIGGGSSTTTTPMTGAPSTSAPADTGTGLFV